MGGDSFLRAAANTRIHDVPFHDFSEEGTGKDFCKQKGAALPFRVSGSTWGLPKKRHQQTNC
jgi:hypothetical protein